MSSRAILIALIERFTQQYPEDAERCARFRQFIQAHPNCAERSLSLGHLTGAAWLVEPSGRQVLLTHHRKLDRWLQLGGHADGDLDIAAVALKEAEEESGLTDLELLPGLLDLDDHRIPARKSEPEHTHYDFRFVIVARGDLQPEISAESIDLRWWPIEELCQPPWEPSIQRMARRWRAEQRQWLTAG